MHDLPALQQVQIMYSITTALKDPVPPTVYPARSARGEIR